MTKLIILSSQIVLKSGSDADDFGKKYDFDNSTCDGVFYKDDVSGCFATCGEYCSIYGDFKNSDLQFIVPDDSSFYYEYPYSLLAFPVHESYGVKTAFDLVDRRNLAELIEAGFPVGFNMTTTPKGVKAPEDVVVSVPALPDPPKIEEARSTLDPIKEGMEKEDDIFKKLATDYLSYDAYIGSVFRHVVTDNDRLALKELIAVFEKHSSCLNMFAQVQNNDYFLSVLVNDFGRVKDKVNALLVDTKVAPEIKKTDFDLSTLNQGSKTMATVSQFKNITESPYHYISGSTMVASEAYVNLYTKKLRIVPVVDGTAHIEHALCTEMVHNMVINQIKETKGQEVADTCGKGSVILSQLTPDMINYMGDISISTYAENDLMISLRFKTQIDQQEVIVSKYVINYLVYRCAFGQPNYYKILYSMILDDNLKKKIEGSNSVKVRKAKATYPEGEMLLMQLHSNKMKYLVFEGEPVLGKLTYGPYNEKAVTSLVNDIYNNIDILKLCSIADRSSFARLHKLFSCSFNETLEYRVLNDLIANGRQVWLNDASDYVRNGFVPASKRGIRSRPPQYEEDEIATKPSVWKEFDGPDTSIPFNLDMTSKTVIEHYLGGFTHNADMNVKRTGGKPDKRAMIYLDSANMEKTAEQGRYVENLYSEMRKDKTDWRLGVIIPFALIGIVRRKYPIKLIVLAPYPFINSFYVVMGPSKGINVGSDYILFLLNIRRVSTLAYANAYTAGFTNLYKLVKFCSREYEDEVSLVWYEWLKEKYAGKDAKFGHKNEYGAIVQVKGNDPKAGRLRAMLKNGVEKGKDEMKMEKDDFDDRIVGEYVEEEFDYNDYVKAFKTTPPKKE